MAATPNLQRQLQQALGAEAAGDFAAWMQSVDAHLSDISELRSEMRAGFAKIERHFERLDERFAKQDERFAKQDERFRQQDERFAKYDERFARVDGRIDTMQERMEKVIERGLREQTRFFFLAWSVLLAAIIGLYARI
jgi:predicted nuclease with TOPRIM domain